MGTIQHNAKVTIAAQLIAEFDNKEDYGKTKVEFLLSIMPKGTKHLSTEVRVKDLHVEFLLTFEHPMFEDGSYVMLDYERDYFKNVYDGITELSVFTGIKYYNPDGTPKYRKVLNG